MTDFMSLPNDEYSAPTPATIGAIVGATTFTELLADLDQLTAEHGGHLLLALEEGDQMFYAASHAGEEHFELPPNIEEMEDLEEEDYEKALAKDRFSQLERVPEWEELRGVLPLGEQGQDVIHRVNANPDLLLEQYHCVQRYEAPGPRSWLADLPNGYFDGDLTPFQVLALANRIEATTPYRFLGMGGNFIGFRLGGGDVDMPALNRDLAHVFGTDLELPKREVLILPYTGTAEQYLERGA